MHGGSFHRLLPSFSTLTHLDASNKLPPTCSTRQYAVQSTYCSIDLTNPPALPSPSYRPAKTPRIAVRRNTASTFHTTARAKMSEFASYTANGTKPKPQAAASSLVDSHAYSHSWGSSTNPAAFDFRSDVTTTPTASMLAAIQQCTLRDDVFMEDPTTLSLERFIADLAGKEDALFVLSGTMGNQVALRVHCSAPPQAIVCDRRGHIMNYEAGGVAMLSQALVQPIDAANGRYMTLEEIQEHAVISDDVHACPTRVVELENTLNGTIMPLSEVRRISGWARGHGVKTHMDGARLWEAVAAGAGTLKEFCAEMDSVSLCFSKGLGAPVGSIIAGNKEFIKRCRWIRKSIGGGLRQAGVVAAPARVAVEETFLSGKLAESHKNAQRIGAIWESLGGKLKYPVETNMVWLDIEHHGISLERWIVLGEKYGVITTGGRLVVHYQISEEAVKGLEELFREVLKGGKGEGRGEDIAFSAELTLKGKEME